MEVGGIFLSSALRSEDPFACCQQNWGAPKEGVWGSVWVLWVLSFSVFFSSTFGISTTFQHDFNKNIQKYTKIYKHTPLIACIFGLWLQTPSAFFLRFGASFDSTRPSSRSKCSWPWNERPGGFRSLEAAELFVLGRRT